jgi:DNA polymerase elongation subunit (family B)
MKTEICIFDIDDEEIEMDHAALLDSWIKTRNPAALVEHSLKHSELRKLLARGIPLGAGTIVGIVIEKGAGSISEKAQPAELADIKKLDKEHYIHHQVLPAVLRVFKVVGVDEAELMKEAR